ncbi:MAG TPA: hopanoid-associated sugar epimerase [Planctomycetota bacterium]|nr:hopanoid-associated sugar epimerase [Planctomycetota bacterium]
MILVTGASGFVGNHVVRALINRGESVRVLVRPSSNLKWLSDLKLDKAVGDLRDRASLDAAVKGCSMLFHVAADYRFDVSNPDDVYKSNVEGTRNLLEAAGSAGVRKIVYTSTVGCIGFTPDGNANEDSPVSIDMMVGTYKRTKFQAEQVALELSKKLPIVIVNPTAPVGELDSKPTPTGEMIVRFLRGDMPCVIATGLNLIDVRDCAEGHVLAAEKGRVGERYILGSRNMTLMEIGQTLAKLTNLKAPFCHIPYAFAYMAAWFDTKIALARGKTPGISLEGVRMGKKRMWVKSDKAVRELGLPQRAPEEALERAVHWYWQNNYAPLPKGRAMPPALVLPPLKTAPVSAGVPDQAGTLN